MFVKDLNTGAITLVSTAADGTLASDNYSDSPVFSPDGSQLAFVRYALVGGLNYSSYIFVKDLNTGAITLVSTAADGTLADNFSYAPVFSPDGSQLAFASYASNLVAGDTRLH